MAKEIWKKIPGYENYQISDLGNVRNNLGKFMTQRLNGTRENNKYLSVHLMANIPGLGWKERGKILSVHRLVALAFHGIPTKGKNCCHKNDIKTDNRLENLYWGTASDNAKDSIKNGTFNFPHPGFGEKHHSVKFSDEIIAKIRSEYTGKHGEQTSLGKKYGITQQHVWAIVTGKLRNFHTEGEC